MTEKKNYPISESLYLPGILQKALFALLHEIFVQPIKDGNRRVVAEDFDALLQQALYRLSEKDRIAAIEELIQKAKDTQYAHSAQAREFLLRRRYFWFYSDELEGLSLEEFKKVCKILLDEHVAFRKLEVVDLNEWKDHQKYIIAIREMTKSLAHPFYLEALALILSLDVHVDEAPADAFTSEYDQEAVAASK